MFDGLYRDAERGFGGGYGYNPHASDPLALLNALERRMDRSDSYLRGQLQALEGRLDTLSDTVQGLAELEAERRRAAELQVVDLADRLDRIEREV